MTCGAGICIGSFVTIQPVSGSVVATALVVVELCS
jgi:hypothetical protein